jgi:hypothetical protein
MRFRLSICLALALAAGCGGVKYASVSGKVTLNGAPLANALVSFQPIVAKTETDAGGVGSTGKTNEQGEFTLTTASGKSGALVGKHQVMISMQSARPGDDDARGRPRVSDIIPDKYNSKSTLTFEVPSGGTTEADFSLKTQ